MPSTHGIHSTTLDNGLQVLVEPNTSVASASMTWLIPAGTSTDRMKGAEHGCSVLLSEMLLRGAGGLSSRQLSDAFDRLGLQRSCEPSVHHVRIGMTGLGTRLIDGLPLAVSMARDPLLDPSTIEPARSLCLQSVRSLADEPQQQVLHELARIQRPSPLNRSGLGTIDGLNSLSIDDLRASHQRNFGPRGSIIAIAGAVDPDLIVQRLSELLGDWDCPDPHVVSETPALGGTSHLQQESAQLHIGLGLPGLKQSDPGSVAHRVAIRMLGSGASSRLFTEVRERRGLCYSVWASSSNGRDRGDVTIYAGSTPERAQETLDCLQDQLAGVRDGFSSEEFSRAIVGIKSRIVMQGESSSARAASLAGDAFRTGRARSLEEITSEYDQLDLEQVNTLAADHLGDQWLRERILVTAGSRELDVTGDAEAARS